VYDADDHANPTSYIMVEAVVSSMAGINDQKANLVFFIYDGKLECFVKSILPKNWKFEQPYPDLPGYILETASGQQEYRPSIFRNFSFDGEVRCFFSSMDCSSPGLPEKQKAIRGLLELIKEEKNVARIKAGLNYYKASIIIGNERSFLPEIISVSGLDLKCSFWAHVSGPPDRQMLQLRIDSVSWKHSFEAGQSTFEIGVHSLSF